MSKFFAAGASDIDSDESGSEDAGLAQVQVQVQQREQQNMLMYESSSSEEEKRVVRSLKDKRYDMMKATIRLLRNSLKINDWVATMQRRFCFVLCMSSTASLLPLLQTSIRSSNNTRSPRS